MLTVTNFN